MQFRPLGKTGIDISAIAFGAGPVSGLLVPSKDEGEFSEKRLATVRQAIESGFNWFDTAATYGQGESERGLGVTLAALGRPSHVHVATKVRLATDHINDIAGQVRESFHASLARLQLPRVTLLQLHNAITSRREEEPTSITPDDVLGKLKSSGDLKGVGLADVADPHAVHRPHRLDVELDRRVLGPWVR